MLIPVSANQDLIWILTAILASPRNVILTGQWELPGHQPNRPLCLPKGGDLERNNLGFLLVSMTFLTHPLSAFKSLSFPLLL